MKRIVFAAILSLSSVASYAQCIGSESFSTCNDDNGNNYTVMRSGNMTTVNGSSQDGTTWNQTTTSMGGGNTYTTGTASNGAHWNETRTNTGGGSYTVSGINSQGESYTHFCNQSGCN